MAYNENKIFDKYFDQLFKPGYPPADILALNRLADHIDRWWKDNALGLNDAMLATPSYSKFHLLIAVQACFCVANNQLDKVPAPSSTDAVLHNPDAVIAMAANCCNSALDVANSEY